MSVRHRELNPDTVAHLSTNRARCRLTLLFSVYIVWHYFLPAEEISLLCKFYVHWHQFKIVTNVVCWHCMQVRIMQNFGVKIVHIILCIIMVITMTVTTTRFCRTFDCFLQQTHYWIVLVMWMGEKQSLAFHSRHLYLILETSCTVPAQVVHAHVPLSTSSIIGTSQRTVVFCGSRK